MRHRVTQKLTKNLSRQKVLNNHLLQQSCDT